MKNRLLIGLAGALYLTICFSSCYYDEVLPVKTEVITEDVSFSGDLIPIFNASCNAVGCHNTGGESPDLTAANAYNQLNGQDLINRNNPSASGLYRWMTGAEGLPMPVSGSNPEYNALVLAWIQQGALDN